MTAQPTPSTLATTRWTRFERDAGAALEQARRTLTDPAARPLDAVGWASTHLAAFERAVLPVVRRAFADGRAAVADLRRHANRLERALRIFERLQTGDVLAAQVDGTRLRAELDRLLDEHLRLQRVLVSRLADRLNPAEQDALAAGYRRALEHAPTRPHPHVPHGGVLGAVAFRVDAVRDRVMDVMDARHVPAPRRSREPVPPGRWGLWLLGRPRDDADPTASRDELD